MIIELNNTSALKNINHYSLKALFYIYKEHRDDKVFSEIYKRTYDNLFDIVLSKVPTSNEACILVQEVFRITRISLNRFEKEQCAIKYLTRVADGCFLNYSDKIRQA